MAKIGVCCRELGIPLWVLVANCDDAELAEMAALVRERNAIDARIGPILGRPVNPGSIAEWVAACIFDIELEAAANAAGIVVSLPDHLSPRP